MNTARTPATISTRRKGMPLMPCPVICRILSSMLLLFALNACAKNPTIYTDVTTYNFTDYGITYVLVDETGIGNAPCNQGGGSVCCVGLPRIYQPDLTITVEWERYDCIDSVYECFYKYKSGEWPKKQFKKQIKTPPYTSKTLADIQLVFLPDDEVRAYVSGYYFSHEKHESRAEFGDLLVGGPRPLEKEWALRKKNNLSISNTGNNSHETLKN